MALDSKTQYENPFISDNESYDLSGLTSFNNDLPSANDLDRIVSNELEIGNITNRFIDPMESDKVSGQTEKLHFANFAKHILVTGADFAQNFFDTFLFLVKNDGSALSNTDAFNNLAQYSIDNENNVTNLWKAVGMYSFTTRTTKIEIPQPKAQTFDHTVGKNVIRKIKSEWDMPKKSSLTMRIDGEAYYIDALNYLSQNNDNTEFDDTRNIKFLNFVGFNKHIAESVKDGTRLDLIVRHVNPSDTNNDYINNANHAFYRESISKDGYVGMVNTRPDNTRSMFWLFEDVKFLGWNDGLEFGHTTAGKQELTTDFIFKRLIRVDPMFLENYLGGGGITSPSETNLPNEIANKINLQPYV